MANVGRVGEVHTLAIMAALSLGAVQIEDRAIGGGRQLQIELLVFRDLDDRQVAALRQEVETIWLAHGVAITWVRDATATSVRVVVDRPVSPLPSAGRDDHWSVASTRVVGGHVTPPIYVSLDAARRVVRAAVPPYSSPSLAGIMVPRVAARALAHELAHVLLDSRVHTPDGLLRARFTADQLAAPHHDPFTLDEAQMAVVRRHHVLLARRD